MVDTSQLFLFVMANLTAFFDKSDEVHCKQKPEWNQTDASHKFVRKCQLLIFLTVSGDCRLYLPNLPVKPHPSRLPKFSCSPDHEISSELLNDLMSDCGLSMSDEPILRTFHISRIEQNCTQPQQLQCKSGLPICFSVHEICLFKLSKFGHLRPCRNGGHLDNCLEFECNGDFKCANSYCILWGYICDGKWDCPQGTDESLLKNCTVFSVTCRQMFKCSSPQRRCVHVGNVCNGQYDCPLHDDEHLCELKYQLCPSNCSCLALAIRCENVSESATLKMLNEQLPYISMNFKFSKLSHPKKLFEVFHAVQIMNAVFASLTDICCSISSKTLKILNLKNNYLTSLSRHCFSLAFNLLKITLSYNKITKVADCSFRGLFLLQYLSLSNNPILILSDRLLSETNALILFEIFEVFPSMIEPNILHHKTIAAVLTSDYRLCCFAPSNGVCTANIPWFLSCNHLLPSKLLQASYICLFVVILVVNILSLFIHAATQVDKNMSFAITICAMNANDILCAVYLSMIWVSDVLQKDQFIVYEEHWRKSFWCFAGFAVCFIFTIFTQFIIVFLSFTRWRVVVNPIQTKMKNVRVVASWIGCLSTAATISGFGITLTLYLTNGEITNTICLPFVSFGKPVTLIFITVWFKAVSELVCLTAVIILHILLLLNLNKSQQQLQKTKSQSESSYALVTQLILLSATNFLCWTPSAVIFVSTSFVSKFPTSLILWTIIGAMPLNSYLNPIILLVVQARRSWKERKK